ncbi:MAG: hypothetical protein GX911_03445 [Spirochaetales bacterium]|nr:hypothetical protein [Spirochaetales bacterium]
MKRTILVVLLIVGVSAGLVAQSGTFTAKLTGALGPGSMDLKAEGAYQVKIPMLQGEGPLFEGNNLKVKGALGISPIAAQVIFDAVLTPVALAEVNLGVAVGSGWAFPLLKMKGLIKAPAEGVAMVDETLKGVYVKPKAGIALQFDTGAVFDSKWASVVLRAHQELNFTYYSNAEKDEPWEFELSGELYNSFNYKGEYIVGYKLPLEWVNLVGLQVQHYVFDAFNRKHGGLVDASILVNSPFPVVDDLSLLMAIQFTNFKAQPDVRNRVVDRLRFKRVALIATYSI